MSPQKNGDARRGAAGACPISPASPAGPARRPRPPLFSLADPPRDPGASPFAGNGAPAGARRSIPRISVPGESAPAFPAAGSVLADCHYFAREAAWPP